MPITIPGRLREKLHTDIAYEGYIGTLIGNTRSLITDKAAFFPEYTIHGWQHIQAVLNHADKLIPDVSLEQLQGRDIALLIAGVILHDLGMFLNEAGVRKLLTGERSRTKNTRLADQDWKNAWDAYIHEIRRYPEEKLLYHFGMSGAIEEPDLTKMEFSDLERLIVGDFLRRHHHRIAHEIALTTMPGDTDLDVLQVGIGAVGSPMFNPMDRKCIGILARSHGMAIRKTWDYIHYEIGKRNKEKLVYLMAVLRIADALDADEQRAPDTVRKLQGIRTPVSVKEWTWNQRIVRTDLDWDFDCKYVEADPQSTTEFVRLEKWLSWVQQELDLCWAVLSEICDTQKYRLSIHRVDSNILEEERRESYGEKFITREARLNANPELLKLLVAPLYDNDPSCGVRELLQNAVDSCNERAHLEGEGYRGQVEIRLDTAARTLTVTDNGIGMDENVLLNYYLSAGASYRTSDEWFRNYATDRDPNIVRTGRFGVGVLATFLLGNTVEVTTRHMDDELGYTFQFGLEPEPLDIKRPRTAPRIGTAIRIHLKDDALEQLQKRSSWLEWYCFAEPSVRYWVDGKKRDNYMFPIPQDKREMPGWFEIPGTEYEMVRWGFSDGGFFCNGIRIPAATKYPLKIDGVWIGFPCVSVIDKKGRLSLDLARKQLQQWPVAAQIAHEAKRYMMAQILTADWFSEKAVAQRICNGMWEWRKPYYLHPVPCVCSSEGYSYHNLISYMSDHDTSMLVVYVDYKTSAECLPDMLRRMNIRCPLRVCRISKLSDESFGFRLGSSRHKDHPDLIERVWTTDKAFQYFSKEHPHSALSYLRGEQRGDIVEFYKAECGPSQDDRLFRWEEWKLGECAAIRQMRLEAIDYRSLTNEDRCDDFTIEFIQTYMNGDPWIPYDMEERRKKFPKAFEELKYYIDRILADREKQ